MKIKNIKDKRFIFEIIYVLSVSFLLIFSLFSNVIAVGDDLSFHMNRIQGLVNAFQDKQILPKLYPYTNNGYGYALPLFYCDIFLYPFAFLYWSGISLVLSYKIMIGFYGALSVISIFYCSKKIFKDYEYAPYISTILYTFCNYRLYDFYLRHAFGENLAIVFIPLILLAIYKILVNKNDSYLLLGFSFGFLLLSHAITFALFCFLFFVLIIVFVCFNKDNKNLLVSTAVCILKAIIIAIVMTAFYLFPMLEQLNSSQIFFLNSYNIKYDISLSASVSDMLLRPFASFENIKDQFGQCKYNLGYVFYYIQLLYILLLIKGKGNKYITVIFAISNIFILFSFGYIPFLNLLSFLNTIQFSFRFNIVVFPLLTIVITFVVCNFDCKRYLIAIVLLYSIINAVVIQNDQINNYELYFNDSKSENIYDYSKRIDDWFYNVYELSGGEYLPETYGINYLKDEKTIKILGDDGFYDACEYIDGVETPIEYSRVGTKITFSYSSVEYPETIMLPLTYYAGYRVYEIDDKGEIIKIIPCENVGENMRLVGFRTDVGKHTYVVHYDGTTTQKVSAFITFFGVAVLLFLYCKKFALLLR